MILLIFFAFLAGLMTILAPCIWPVLPIVLSSSLSGGHRKPLGITLGVILSFTSFTLAASFLVKALHLDPNLLRIMAVVVIILLGLMLITPSLEEKFQILISKLSSRFSGSNQGSGFVPGFITGLSLGIVWSPCAGPILATVAALSSLGQVNLAVALVTLAYVTGVGVPLLALSLGGQELFKKFKGVGKYTLRIQQIFGVVMILSAIAIYNNLDQSFQLYLLDRFPSLGTAVNGFENSALVTSQLDQLKGKQSTQITDTSALFNVDTPAPDLVGITHWLNTDQPLTISALKGRVVLVDFWTYTCINCIRTLPHVTSWYDKYKNNGFVVIGVHTPEFEFEHDTNNVLDATRRFNIHYPVAQDNNYSTWNNFNNQYWPAEYLIDAKGHIRREEFGEGNYDQTEQAIQELLKEAGQEVSAPLVDMPDTTPTTEISPETYLGSKRMQYYYPSESLRNGSQSLTLSPNLPEGSFSLGGNWIISDESATAGAGANLNYHFSASKVYIILSPAPVGSNQVKVYLDGSLISPDSAGADVKDGVVTVDSQRLYNVVDLKNQTEQHILRLEFPNPGVQAYTFTFG